MSSVNRVTLLGRLGRDPELKFTPSGMAVCNFTLATSENWKDEAGEKNEKTEWHKVVVWGKLAELSNQYLKKGSLAYLEGKLQTRSWDNKEGVKQYTTEINASTIQFLSGRVSEDSEPSLNKAQSMLNDSFDVKNNAGYTTDSIPF